MANQVKSLKGQNKTDTNETINEIKNMLQLRIIENLNRTLHPLAVTVSAEDGKLSDEGLKSLNICEQPEDCFFQGMSQNTYKILNFSLKQILEEYGNTEDPIQAY